MTYKINGVALSLQPTSGQWAPRRPLGADGEGRAIYSPLYSFMLQWDAMSVPDFDQLYEFWRATSAIGVNQIDLPEKGADEYQFNTYSGVLDEPQAGEYFQGFQLRVEMSVRKIMVT